MARIRARDDPFRYPRFAGANPKRVPWRTRSKRIQTRKSASEKARHAQLRQSRKVVYNEALELAETAILGEAQKISISSGKKTPQQCYKDLLQRSRLVHTRRAPSKWNAYLRNEVRKRNDGKYFSLLTMTRDMADLPIPSPWARCSSSEGIVLRQ